MNALLDPAADVVALASMLFGLESNFFMTFEATLKNWLSSLLAHTSFTFSPLTLSDSVVKV